MATSFLVPSLERLHGVAADLATRRGLDLVVLFGSAARADAGVPIADVDIGVRRAGSGLADAVELTNAFIEALQIQAVDLVDLRRADPLLLMQVALNGIPLYEHGPSTFAEFVSLAARRFADTKKFRDAEAEFIDDFLTARGEAP